MLSLLQATSYKQNFLGQIVRKHNEYVRDAEMQIFQVWYQVLWMNTVHILWVLSSPAVANACTKSGFIRFSV